MSDVDAGTSAEAVTLAYVERLEGEWAVLVLDGGVCLEDGVGVDGVASESRDAPFEVPVALLPRDAREGDAVWLRVSRDPAQTRRARARTRALQERLMTDDDGGDISL